MEYNYRDCNNELMVKLLGKLTLEFTIRSGPARTIKNKKSYRRNFIRV